MPVTYVNVTGRVKCFGGTAFKGPRRTRFSNFARLLNLVRFYYFKKDMEIYG